MKDRFYASHLGRRLVWKTPLLFCVCLATAFPSAFAEDIVFTRGQRSDKISKRRGLIESWKGQTLVIQSGGRSREISGDRIVRIETAWNEQYQAGKTELQQRNFREAIARLKRAIVEEQRIWARDIARAELIKAYRGNEQHLSAVQEFGQIFTRDPQTRFLYLLPLAWTQTVQGGEAARFTEPWLTSDEAALKLLACSWNLGGSRRTNAVAGLESLVNDAEPEIAQLAMAQLWRAKAGRVNKVQVDQWNVLLEQIPKPFRAGPYYTLGTAQIAIRQVDEAAISLMKLPILYPQHPDLAAAALYKCGKLLHNEQRNLEARTCWSELVRDYPNSTWASQVDMNKLSERN